MLIILDLNTFASPNEKLMNAILPKADTFMNVKRLKIFQLLSGLMVGMTTHGEINLCKDLDWKRSFALHLWLA